MLSRIVWTFGLCKRSWPLFDLFLRSHYLICFCSPSGCSWSKTAKICLSHESLSTIHRVFARGGTRIGEDTSRCFNGFIVVLFSLVGLSNVCGVLAIRANFVLDRCKTLHRPKKEWSSVTFHSSYNSHIAPKDSFATPIWTGPITCLSSQKCG